MENSKQALLKETVHEDIIYDDSYSEGYEESVQGTGDNILSIVEQNDQTSDKNDQDDTEVINKPDTNAGQSESDMLEELLEALPEQFPVAVDMIRNEIAPIVLNCSAGIKDHYIKVIKKITGAASIKSVSLLINEAYEQMNEIESVSDEADIDAPHDPEIQALADQIASNPSLLKNRIDIVNQLGVIGERKNIGLYMVAMDSCLLPMGRAGSEALALKNSGHYGAGKSYPLFMCLKLYPQSAYHLISSGSDKSLYSMKEGLKHKALILAEALTLESRGNRDNELAYGIRTLVSEGHLKYQYTGFKDKKRVTIIKKVEGPTSLITTTIKGKLEDQLDDRMITIHPNTSAEQTQDIISRTADLASGNGDQVEDKTIKAWQYYYESLESVEVVVPFAKDISDFINEKGSLPCPYQQDEHLKG